MDRDPEGVPPADRPAGPGGPAAGTRGDPIAPFLEARGFLVLDGGLATELEAAGCDLDDPLWSAAALLERPDAVAEVHTRFLEAGADVIATCTYQATFEGLRARGMDDGEAESILRGAVEVARGAVDGYVAGASPPSDRPKPLVAASVGPYGAYLADGSEYRGAYGLTEGALRDFHGRRWAVLADAGADLLAVETVPSAPEARALAGLLRSSPGTRAWISFSCRDGRRISDGTPLAAVARELDGTPGLVAIGINCTAPELIAPLIGEARRGTSLPILVYPNAGGRWNASRGVWETPRTPIDWERSAMEWLGRGASGVGGCCRIGPDEIAELRRVLEARAP